MACLNTVWNTKKINSIKWNYDQYITKRQKKKRYLQSLQNSWLNISVILCVSKFPWSLFPFLIIILFLLLGAVFLNPLANLLFVHGTSVYDRLRVQFVGRPEVQVMGPVLDKHSGDGRGRRFQDPVTGPRIKTAVAVSMECVQNSEYKFIWQWSVLSKCLFLYIFTKICLTRSLFCQNQYNKFEKKTSIRYYC